MNHFDPYDPKIQRVEERLRTLYTEWKSAKLGRPTTINRKHDQMFRNAAEQVVRQDMDVDVYFNAQVAGAKDPMLVLPNYLSGANALARAKSFFEGKGEETSEKYYLAMFTKVDRLMQAGCGPDDIMHGNYDLTPLITWLYLHTNGHRADAQRYRSEALAELKANPCAARVFGQALRDLQC